MGLSGTAALSSFPLGLSANGLRFVPGLASLLRDIDHGEACLGGDSVDVVMKRKV